VVDLHHKGQHRTVLALDVAVMGEDRRQAVHSCAAARPVPAAGTDPPSAKLRPVPRTRGTSGRPHNHRCPSPEKRQVRDHYDRRVLLSVADRQEVLEAVSAALGELVVADADLLELDAHELALVHRFGVYLERFLALMLGRNLLTVDLDYDRHCWAEKLLPPRPDRDGDQRFRPDLVVYRRTTDDFNLLVLEWKKHAGQPILGLLAERIRA
jgi:hypothetical protein